MIHIFISYNYISCEKIRFIIDLTLCKEYRQLCDISKRGQNHFHFEQSEVQSLDTVVLIPTIVDSYYKCHHGIRSNATENKIGGIIIGVELNWKQR